MFLPCTRCGGASHPALGPLWAVERLCWSCYLEFVRLEKLRKEAEQRLQRLGWLKAA